MWQMLHIYSATINYLHKSKLLICSNHKFFVLVIFCGNYVLVVVGTFCLRVGFYVAIVMGWSGIPTAGFSDPFLDACTQCVRGVFLISNRRLEGVEIYRIPPLFLR